MVTAITIISFIGAMYLGIIALHEWREYREESRKLAAKECGLASLLEPDTLTDGSIENIVWHERGERSGIFDVDEDSEPTIPSARCPDWDMHERTVRR